MGTNHNRPDTGKLYFDVLAASTEMLHTVRRRLALDFSPVDVESPALPSVTGGTDADGPLLRVWFSTTLPIHLTELADIRRFTTRLEQSYAESHIGPVIIAPGYVTSDKAVRAVGTDADHRVLLGRGIYAEPVARFSDDQSVAWWPWTPPDYTSAAAADFLLKVRNQLLIDRGSELVSKG